MAILTEVILICRLTWNASAKKYINTERDLLSVAKAHYFQLKINEVAVREISFSSSAHTHMAPMGLWTPNASLLKKPILPHSRICMKQCEILTEMDVMSFFALDVAYSVGWVYYVMVAQEPDKDGSGRGDKVATTLNTIIYCQNDITHLLCKRHYILLRSFVIALNDNFTATVIIHVFKKIR